PREVRARAIADLEALAHPEVAGRGRRRGLADADGSDEALAAVEVEGHPSQREVDPSPPAGDVKTVEGLAQDPSHAPVGPPRDAQPHPLVPGRVGAALEQQVDLG